jgi:predicted ATPase
VFISELSTKNFRQLEDVILPFSDDVTVLIGPNNVGKSNVIDALKFVQEGFGGRAIAQLLSSRQGFQRIVTGHLATSFFSLHVGLGSTGDSYSIEVDARGLRSERAQLGKWGHEGKRVGDSDYLLRRSDGGETRMGGTTLNYPFLPHNPAEAQEFRDFFMSMSHVDPFRSVSYENQVGQKAEISPTGGDLAQVLHFHYNNDRERFDAFEDIARQVLPELQLIETPITGAPTATVRVRFMDDSERYDLWQLSSGIKEVLLLLAAVYFSAPLATVILEEPENHLHPLAQKALCSVIKDRVAEEGKQFVITTHAESIIGQFPPEKTIFLSKHGGRTIAQPLAAASLYQVWAGIGMERNLLLQVLGRERQVIMIVEGRTDRLSLEPIWQHFDLEDKVLAATAGGGGWREIVDEARELQNALSRFRLPSLVFLLLDNDGERSAKLAYLRARGFEDSASHVWEEKELESYLLLPGPLSRIAGKSEAEAAKTIAEATGRGKARFKQVLERLGIPGTPPNLIVANALATNPSELPSELTDIPATIRSLLGMSSL